MRLNSPTTLHIDQPHAYKGGEGGFSTRQDRATFPSIFTSKMLLSTVSLALALCAQKVAAHGGVLSYKIGGQYYKGFAPYNSASGQVTIQRQWNTLYVECPHTPFFCH